MAGFLKKLVGGVNKAVGAIAGIGAKILPAPIGTAAKAVQGISGFASKILDGGKKPASATASVGAAAKAAASAVLPSAAPSTAAAGIPPITIGEKKSWFMENIAWVIPTGLAFLGGLIWLIIPKRKR